MPDSTSDPDSRTGQAVQFANGRIAHLLKTPLRTSGREIVAQLKQQGLQPPAGVILVFGGAGQIAQLSDYQRARLIELFSRGVAQAAAEVIKVKVKQSAPPEEQKPAGDTAARRFSLKLRRPQDKPPAATPGAPPREVEVEKGIVIVDGGTNAGVMAMVGQGAADRHHRTPLIGVAPYHLVTYPGKDTADEDSAPLEPNHTHFVLPESHEWGGETETLFEIAAALEKDEQTGEKIPVVVVLAGGTPGQVAQQEILSSVRHGWPVMIIEGSGGVADRIADLYREKKAIDQRRQRSQESGLRHLWWRMNLQELSTSDPALVEIVSDGKLSLFAPGYNGADLRQAILQPLLRAYVSPVLYMAWARHADYDLNAKRHQHNFFWLQGWILFLGIVATVLAVLFSTLPSTTLAVTRLDGAPLTLHDLLRYLTVFVTVLITLLAAYSNHFDPGGKWVVLRANAESLKREIYPYRVRGDTYSEEELKPKNMTREAQLADRVGSIGRSTMRTEVSTSAVIPYEGYIPAGMFAALGEDDGFQDLTPDQYVKIRIGDQIRFRQSRTKKLERSLQRWQTLGFAAIGTSTLLAALGAEPWVPVVTASATAIASYIEYHQLKMTLIKYNQSENDLANLKGWWDGLSDAEKRRPANVNQLVKLAEQILETETSGWARRMQNALAELRKAQEKTQASSETGETAGSDQAAA